MTLSAIAADEPSPITRNDLKAVQDIAEEECSQAGVLKIGISGGKEFLELIPHGPGEEVLPLDIGAGIIAAGITHTDPATGKRVYNNDLGIPGLTSGRFREVLTDAVKTIIDFVKSDPGVSKELKNVTIYPGRTESHILTLPGWMSVACDFRLYDPCGGARLRESLSKAWSSRLPLHAQQSKVQQPSASLPMEVGGQARRDEATSKQSLSIAPAVVVTMKDGRSVRLSGARFHIGQGGEERGVVVGINTQPSAELISYTTEYSESTGFGRATTRIVPWKKISEVQISDKPPEYNDHVTGRIIMTDGKSIPTKIMANRYYRLLVGNTQGSECPSAPSVMIPPAAGAEGKIGRAHV